MRNLSKFTEDKDVDAMYKQFNRKFLKILDQFAEPKAYVLDAVAGLREAGIKIGSTTGYTDETMEIVTREAKKAGYAPDFVCTPDFTNHKGRPYPYMVFENMKALGVSSVNRVIKVGDTISDIKEGKNAGVVTVGVIEGSSEMGLSRDEFEGLSSEEKEIRMKEVEKRYMEAGADYVVADIRGILKIVGIE